MEQEVWKDGTGNYLKVREEGEGEETLSDRMFMHQNIPGFLSMELIRIDGKKDYIYDISGKVSLSHYLSERDVTKEELQSIIKQLLKLPDIAQEYLLDGNGVVCHEDYIYIDSRNGQVNGVYHEQSPYGDVKAFGVLLESIMEKINAKDEAVAFFIYGMHRLVKEAGTTRQLLLEYTEKGTEETREEIRVPYERKEERRISVTDNLPKMNQRVSCILSYLLLGLGVLMTLMAWYCGWFRQPLSDENDLAMGLGASIFFLGISGYGAWRIRPSKPLSDTIWQDREREAKACLISCQGKIESIPIVHYPFVLGAERERVDGIVSAAGIERVHAQILCEGNEIYVFDEESEEGTYHNNERLIPYHKKRLQDGDILRLAKTEFVVEIS